jgi:predicted secreted hydrolase
VGGLHFQTLKAMSDYRIQFAGGEIHLDITWKAETPFFDYKDCVAALPRSLAAEHYEQSGIVLGSFEYGGVRHPVHGFGHRDHSWGVRHWEGFRDWVAFMAPFGAGSYLHLEQFNEESSGLTRHGFVFHNDRNIPLKDADISLDIPPGHQYPTRFAIRVYDAEDGTYDFRGDLRLTSPLSFGRCNIGESFGTYRDSKGNETMGIIEYGFTS